MPKEAVVSIQARISRHLKKTNSSGEVETKRDTGYSELETTKTPVGRLSNRRRLGSLAAATQNGESLVEKTQRKRVSSSRQAFVLLKMSSITLLTALYFTFALRMGIFSSLFTVLSETPVNENLASYRQTQSHRIMHFLRMLGTGVSLQSIDENPSSHTIGLENVLAQVNELDHVHQQLMYGSKSLNVAGLMYTDHVTVPAALQQLELSLVDSCPSFKSDNVLRNNCPVFMHGLLAGGLHSALVGFLDLSKHIAHEFDMLQKNLRTTAPPGSGVWHTFSVLENNSTLNRPDFVPLAVLEQVS